MAAVLAAFGRSLSRANHQGWAFDGNDSVRNEPNGRRMPDRELQERRAWATDYVEQKEAAREPGAPRFSLKEYIENKWPEAKGNPSEAHRLRCVLYRGVKRKLDGEDCSIRRCPGGTGRKRTRRVAPSKRKRTFGGGRAALAPELSTELRLWFVDTVTQFKARVGNKLLLAQGQRIARELHQYWALKAAQESVLIPRAIPNIPKINESWLRRWRIENGISWRCVTIVYKVSRIKLRSRLGVCWRNNIRLRAFHRFLFGEDRLRMRAYDQKPEYHNACGGQKTLAVKGAKVVEVRENGFATRSRYTIMTKSVDKAKRQTHEEAYRLSNKSRDPRRLAVCFRANNQSLDPGAAQRKDIMVPADTFLQFSNSGSHKLGDVLDFLKQDLGHSDDQIDGTPDDGRNAELVYLDWYAAHRCQEVQELIEAKGHVHLLLGGGTTPWVATLDTHAHADLARVIRTKELEDNEVQLRRGWMLPSTSKQTVIDRAVDSWKSLDHEKMTDEAWTHDGLNNDLNGDDDPHLSHMIRPFWAELQMDQVRSQLIEEVEDACRRPPSEGGLSKWCQYKALLEPYDDHDAIEEGMEGSRIRVCDEHEDEGPGDDDGEGPGGGDEGDDDEGGGGGGPGEEEAQGDHDDAPGGEEEPEETEGEDMPGGGEETPGGGDTYLEEALEAEAPDDATAAAVAGAGWRSLMDQAIFDGAHPPSCETIVGATGGGAAATCFFSPSVQWRAKKQVARELSTETVTNLIAMRKTCKDMNDTKTANFLNDRIVEEEKKRTRHSEGAKIHLRCLSLERNDAEKELRAERLASTEKVKKAIEAQKLAELELQLVKAGEGKARAEAKKQVEEAKAAKEKEKIWQHDCRQKDERNREYYASFKCQELWRQWDEEKGKATKRDRRTILEAVLKAAKAREGHKNRAVPAFWPATHQRYIILNPNVRHSEKQPKIYGSPNFAWLVLGGKMPKEFHSAQVNVEQRLQVMLNKCCPHYDTLMLPRWTGRNLLEVDGFIADLAFVSGVWRYTQCLKNPVAFPGGVDTWPPLEDKDSITDGVPLGSLIVENAVPICDAG